jgi:hypothetical protein
VVENTTAAAALTIAIRKDMFRSPDAVKQHMETQIQQQSQLSYKTQQRAIQQANEKVMDFYNMSSVFSMHVSIYSSGDVTVLPHYTNDLSATHEQTIRDRQEQLVDMQWDNIVRCLNQELDDPNIIAKIYCMVGLEHQTGDCSSNQLLERLKHELATAPFARCYSAKHCGRCTCSCHRSSPPFI